MGNDKSDEPIKKKRKLVDYLLYRGWESTWVYQAAADLD